MDEQLTSKRYEPPLIDLTDRNSGHTFLIELTGYKKNVLEIGTSTGYLSKILKDHKNTVTGIEIDPEAGSLAQRYCDRMIISDVETLDFNKNFNPASFDVILCGDVLEHLKNPVLVLKKVKKFLKPGGYLVVSLPNFCHGDVFLNLLNGDFRYTPVGLLDETHLRFFGLKNIYTLFATCGYQITDLHTTNLEIGNTELRINSERIPHDLLRLLRSLPNSTVYQFIFIATPSAEIKIPSFDEIDLNKIFFDSLVDSRSSIQSPVLEEIAGKKQQLLEITDKFTTLSKHANNLEEIIVDREKQISDLSRHSHNLEAVIIDRDNQITKQTQHIQDLEVSVFSRDNQIAELRQYIHDLEISVTDKDKHIADLSRHAYNLELIVKDRDYQILEFSKHTRNLEAIITENNKQIPLLAARIQSLQEENNSIKQSITYQFTEKIHRKIIQPIFPPNSRRRKYYNLGLKGTRILVNKGWKSFWYQFKNRINNRNTNSEIKNYQGTEIETLIKPEKGADILNVSISVIIPTKNAGTEFIYTLEKINNQKGIKNIEIVIVDSSSTDTTLEIAKKFHCKIYSVKSENFNHGLTRNFGARQASGDYIVFTVQDAIPIGDYWLYNLVRPFLEDQKIAAVTCRQVPRSDADLFACYSMWYHYQTMEFHSDKIVHINKDEFNNLPIVEKRKLAGIDDVCSCFRKSIFDQFRFEKLDFAEDLNLGIRLVEAGYKLAFLHSTGVIHSHNRNAEYFIRRYYVDSKSLIEIYDVIPEAGTKDLDQAINYISVLFRRLNSALAKISMNYPYEIDVNIFFAELIHHLNSNELLEKDDTGNSDLDKLIKELKTISTSKSDETLLFTNDFLPQIRIFQEYAKYCYSTAETRELNETILKLFAAHSGAYLGNLYYHNSKRKEMQDIDSVLKKGI